jgi:hypothetical protein
MKKCFLSTTPSILHHALVGAWFTLAAAHMGASINRLLITNSLAPFVAIFCWVKSSPHLWPIFCWVKLSPGLVRGMGGIGYWGLGLEKNQTVQEDLTIFFGCIKERRKGWHAEDQVGWLRSRVCQKKITFRANGKNFTTSNKQTKHATSSAL